MLSNRIMQKMHVGINESGQNQSAFCIDQLGVGTGQAPHFFIAADCYNLSASASNCLGPGLDRVDGVNVGMMENQICFHSITPKLQWSVKRFNQTLGTAAIMPHNF